MNIKKGINIIGIKEQGQYWIAVDDVLKDLENAIEKGNVEGMTGFSPGIWISNLKKKLEGERR